MVRILLFALILHLFVGHLWAQQESDSLEQNITRQLRQPNTIKDYDKFINSVKDFAERNPARGKDYAQQTLRLCEQMTSPKKQRYIAQALNALGSVHVLQDRLDSAFLLYNAALKIEVTEQNLTNVASLTNNLGLVFNRRGQTDSAQKYYRNALKMYEQIKIEPLGIARAQNNIGRIYDVKGIFDSALVFYEQSLRIREKIGDKVAASTVLDNMAIVQGKMGNYDTAIALALKALQIHEATKDKYGQGFSLNSLGYLHQRQGNYDVALKYYLQALAIREELGAKNAIGAALNNIGALYRLKGNYDLSLQYYLRGIKISESLGSASSNLPNSNLPNLFNNVGSLYTYKNILDSALWYFSQALKVYTKTKVPQGLASVYNNIAGVFLKQLQLDSALLYSIKALSIADSLNAKPEKIDIYQGLSSIYEARGEHKKALEYERLKVAIRDSLFNEQKSKQIAELQTKYDVERKDKTISLLTKDKAINDLLMKNQESELTRERIASENRRQEIALLLGEKELSELRSSQAQSALREKELLTKQQAQQMNILSQEKTLTQALLQRQILVRNAVIGGAIALAIILGLLVNRYRIKKNAEEQLRLKNQEIAHLAQEKALADERGRIAKDIHDEVGPGMMRIALLAGALEEKIQDGEGGVIADSAQEVIDAMNGIIWMTNPKNDTLDNLAGYIQEKATEWFERIGEGRGMTLNVVLPDVIPALPLEGNVRRNLYLCVKEALNNALKHSAASRVELALVFRGNEGFEWCVGDNGQGFEPNSVSRFSNGLANMRSRMEEIGGTCKMESVSGQGTTVRFIVG